MLCLGAQFLKILVPELALPARFALALGLRAAELDAADLAADGLGKRGEFQAPDALVGRQPRAAEAEELQRQLARGLRVAAEDDVGLGDGEAHRVRAGHDRGLRPAR